MKNAILPIATILLLTFIGCKKEDDLSDFVIGTWVTQEVIIETPPHIQGIPSEVGIIEIKIMDNKYSMKFNDEIRVGFFDPSMTVNPSKNQITVPFNYYLYGIYQEDDPFTLSFNVEWSFEDRSTMTWRLTGGGTSLIWTRK